ncbi:GNAT family N-acetyltransferase [Aerococcaceae bacterium NML190073]|nr:GNAT family N-acetyltransferase [Aerococcaceae bacterium NML190073]
MEVELTIRQALPDDAWAVVDLLKQVRRETDYVIMELLSVEQQARLLEQYAYSSNSIMLVAELGEQIIGLANLIAVSECESELGVCIRQAYWGHGIGKAIVAALIEFAEEVGTEHLVLEVARDNERAIHLYRQFDFVEQQANSTADTIWMSRKLS